MIGKRILITTGGTGGHIFPAHALAVSIKKKCPECSILFVGGKLASNPFFNKRGFSVKEISCATLSLSRPLQLLKGIFHIIKGFFQSRGIIKSFKPDFIIGFGSFYTFPLLLCAVFRKIPFVLHEQNVLPGQVNCLFSRYSELTTVNFSLSRSYFITKVKPVQMPLRDSFRNLELTKPMAKKQLGLDINYPTLLVFGGSQGAVSINRCFLKAIKKIVASFQHFQVIHLIGRVEDLSIVQQLYQELPIKSYISRFEEDMASIFLASDLTIARAGALSIEEHIAIGVPAILIPYPYSKDNHQEYNADFYIKNAKGAVKILQKDLTEEMLSKLVLDLLMRYPDKLNEMRQGILAYKKHENKQELVDLVLDLIGV